MTISFTVYGRPQGTGSKRVGNRGQVFDANPNARRWMDEVWAACRKATNGDLLLTGPIALRVDFYLARPKSHYGTGRNSEILKPNMPQYPTVVPDTTKLLRCLEDALTGTLWKDDCQVVTQLTHKRYGRPERAEVTVSAPAIPKETR